MGKIHKVYRKCVANSIDERFLICQIPAGNQMHFTLFRLIQLQSFRIQLMTVSILQTREKHSRMLDWDTWDKRIPSMYQSSVPNVNNSFCSKENLSVSWLFLFLFRSIYFFFICAFPPCASSVEYATNSITIPSDGFISTGTTSTAKSNSIRSSSCDAILSVCHVPLSQKFITISLQTKCFESTHTLDLLSIARCWQVIPKHISFGTGMHFQFRFANEHCIYWFWTKP